ncbi:hypothetical protein GALMADRAFT_1201610 [Galerina marginata CBS 339.88]|uniref:CHAT domain-containing protein n=1 Tax=Galerina marginata (strain CBS 339.88) TaxID=685588 RepID=A0A067TDS6_GALM3|nr:hypothetical protein GALMADRAFT_1201610 [Galerina marginata CBS 339.88]
MFESRSPVNQDTLSPLAASCHVLNDATEAGSNKGLETSQSENHPPQVVEQIQIVSATEVNVGANVNDEKATETTNFASSLMAECKAVLSFATLDEAVLLFRQVLDRRPMAHPLHSEAMRNLASALGVRFMYTDQINDAQESLNFRRKVFKHNRGTNRASGTFYDQDDGDTEDMLHRAKTSLTDFKKSTSLDGIRTIISLLEESLAFGPGTHPAQITTLITLADGLYARFHHSNQISDLDKAISSLQNAVEHCIQKERRRPKDTIHRIAIMFAARFDFTGDILDLQRAFSQCVVVNVTETKSTQADLSILIYAQEIYKQFEKSGNMDDLNTAVTLYRLGMMELPGGSDNYAMAVNNLAAALRTRFKQGGQRDDLDEAISLHRQALELFIPPHPNRSSYLNNLASALKTRFEQGGRRDDLDEAISLHRQALELCPPPHRNRSSTLDNLASVLVTRFEHGSQQGDIDEAILLHREALELFPPSHPSRSSSLNNLASALSSRFEQGGRRGDLDEAIFFNRQALELRATPHPLQFDSLNNLASALRTRFGQGGQESDLDEAVSLHKQALRLLPPSHPLQSISLSNLANALLTRFQQGNQQGDLAEAVSLHRQALKLRSPPNPNRSSSLNNLADALLTQFEQGGHLGDLDEAVLLHREAIELFPPPHPNRSISLINLAAVLSTRFEQAGQRSDLDDAISFQRQALELRATTHPLRSNVLNNLATTLLRRFEQADQRDDLDEAILLHRQAVELFPPPHPSRSSSLSNLAAVLKTRFERGGQRSDLDEAILLNRQALELRVPPHPLRSNSLSNLASALRAQFVEGGQLEVLDEAISLHRQALELFPPPHPLRSGSLINLANGLSKRFKQVGQQGDLDEAIFLNRQALELQSPPHPDLSSSHRFLGILLMSAYQVTNDPSHLTHAMSSFSAAMQCLSKSPSQHFRVAQTWAYYADLYHHRSAIEAYDAVLYILPQLAALSLDIKSRHEALTARSDGLARKAARCAIREGFLDKAVEYLDTGRAVFWSQLVHLRSPIDQLHSCAPELANRLRNIASVLEHGSHRDTFSDTLDNRKKMTLEEETSRLARLDKEWSKIIDEVRALDGFEDFLQPRTLSSLQEAAAESPVVHLISNDDSSHCLIVTSTDIHCIVFSTLSVARLRDLVCLIQAAASQSKIWRSSLQEFSQNAGAFSPAIQKTLRNWVGLEEKRGMRYEGQISSDDIFRSVLKTIWDEVVKPVVDFLDLQKSENPLALYWCPTGMFSFLPIHAAGCYDNELGIECASDYLVSSYTPTIGALLTRNPTPSTGPFKMMVVVQSQDLPSTRKELEKIEQYVSKDSLIKLGIPGTTASVEGVASRLPDVSIAHFACHGKQVRSKPLASGLKLEDGMLQVSRIMKEHMPNGSVAFLSACETAMGDAQLPDEAMSLAASLLFSGFRHVIATMWEMRDGDGPLIADNFYKELFRSPDGKLALQPDTSRSAQALHAAVKELRAKGVPFRGWVPFIHMGK